MTLAELRAIDEARTPGPWVANECDVYLGVDGTPDFDVAFGWEFRGHIYDEGGHRPADATAIATHANAFPLLLAIAEAAAELVDSARPDGLGLGSFGRLVDALDALEETT